MDAKAQELPGLMVLVLGDKWYPGAPNRSGWAMHLSATTEEELGRLWSEPFLKFPMDRTLTLSLIWGAKVAWMEGLSGLRARVSPGGKADFPVMERRSVQAEHRPPLISMAFCWSQAQGSPSMAGGGAECKERPWALLKESMRAVSKCRVIRTYLPSGDKVLLDSDGMEVAHGVSLHTGDGVEMIHDMALHSGDGIEIAHGVVHLLNKWK